jgi:transposase
VLEAAADLAAGWRLGGAASQAAGQAQRRRQDRLVARRRGLQPYPCPFGGLLTGPSPVDRARAGSKHHLLVDATGIPLAVTLTGGNRNDVTQLLPLLDDLHGRPIAGKVGRPRQKPDLVLADRGYDHDKYRRLLWARGIKSVIARRGAEHGSNLGRQRWVVERGFAHLHNFRRLRTRYERDPEIHEAFLNLACAILYFRRLQSFSKTF